MGVYATIRIKRGDSLYTPRTNEQRPKISYGKSNLQTTPLAQKQYGKNVSLASICDLEKLAVILQNGSSIADIEKENIKVVRSKSRKNLENFNESKQDDSQQSIKNWAKEITFQLWKKNESSGLIDSRFIVCTFSKTAEDSEKLNHSTHIFDRIFGNVDLIVFPDIRKNNTKEIIRLSRASRDLDVFIKALERRHLINISRYLDHGQTIHIANFLEQLTIKKLKNSSKDPYKQVVIDYINQLKNAPHGKVLTKKSCETLNVLHETALKEKIILSKELRVSSSGCLGPVVYCTQAAELNIPTLNDEHKQITGIISGLGIGINRRMHNGAIKKENFLSIQAKNDANDKTNLIERLGFGRLWLESYLQVKKHITEKRNEIAHSHQKNETEEQPHNNEIETRYYQYMQDMALINMQQTELVDLYKELCPLFNIIREYNQSIKPTIEDKLINNPGDDKEAEEALHEIFKKVWIIIDRFREVNPKEKPVNQNFINNLLFETLKDYIFLYQDTPASKKLEELCSFDSTNHYEFVFSLIPCMKESGKWDTGTQFKPDLDKILLKFKEFNIPVEIDQTKSIFELFFMSRFCYYINVALLENTEQLPNNKISFDTLARELPNMTGILFRNIILEVLPEKSELCQELREAFNKNYNDYYMERDLRIIVKNNLFPTEEVGIFPTAKSTIYSPEFKEVTSRNGTVHCSFWNEQELDVRISGTISNEGGLARSKYTP